MSTITKTSAVMYLNGKKVKFTDLTPEQCEYLIEVDMLTRNQRKQKITFGEFFKFFPMITQRQMARVSKINTQVLNYYVKETRDPSNVDVVNFNKAIKDLIKHLSKVEITEHHG